MAEEKLERCNCCGRYFERSQMFPDRVWQYTCKDCMNSNLVDFVAYTLFALLAVAMVATFALVIRFA